MADRDPSHRETGQAWDIVARAKYRAELSEHVEFLRSGGHNLLEPELEIVESLLSNADVVQLQCSHGLDALGLLNAGARSVLGIDISDEMIAQANAKASALGATNASFLCCDVTSIPADLEGTADLIYTGRGSLPWILDLGAWATSVRRLLRPSASIFIFEGHPLAALWDRDSADLRLRPKSSYFDDAPAEQEGFPADLVRRELGPTAPRMLETFWRPGQVIDALVSGGLQIRLYREYSTLYWDQFPSWPDSLKSRLPNSYALLAVRA